MLPPPDADIGKVWPCVEIRRSADGAVTVEPWRGERLSRACAEAVAVAKDLRRHVTFRFRGVWLIVTPEDTAAEVEDRYKEHQP